ncbi:MAG: M23 family metallopeptidase [Actinomycetota bacterium]
MPSSTPARLRAAAQLVAGLLMTGTLLAASAVRPVPTEPGTVGPAAAGALLGAAGPVRGAAGLFPAGAGPVVVSTPTVPADRAGLAGGPTARSGCAAGWLLPVDAPVVDGYRPPADPFGPGNRGLEFDTRSGDSVRAVAAGIVRFAGPVGGDRFVTVEHPSGLRSTYGFVDASLVDRGESVTAGQPLAVAGPGFHLTARLGGRYRDPTPLFEATCTRIRLVPVPVGARQTD